MDTSRNWKIRSHILKQTKLCLSMYDLPQKKKRKKMYGKNKFIKSEVKSNKCWNYEHKVYKANSKKSNKINICGKVF